MGIIRLSELEPWIGVAKPGRPSAPNALDAAWSGATEAASAIDTAAAAFGGLEQAANDLADGAAPPAEWTRRFDEAVGKLPVAALPDEDVADFRNLARQRAGRLKTEAIRRQHADLAARFEDTLDLFVEKAADAPDDAAENAFRRQALRSIARMDGAGLLGPGVADQLRAGLPARIDRALALRAIERDPAHAATLLTQPGALAALDGPERARLVRKAGIRAERQTLDRAVAAARDRLGAVAGLWSRIDTLDNTDIDAAEADGQLRAAEAIALRERLQADRAARRQRIDSVMRVDAALAGDGALDPASSDDRRAVDAHFAEAERAWDENRVPAERRPVLIGAYVGMTGVLPPALKTRIGAAFRGGDADRQNEAAGIIEAVGRAAGSGALKDVAIDDLLQAALILGLHGNGVEPDAAAARAGAILDGDAEARDRFFERDIVAAGDWVEGSGCFEIEQIVRLRERLDGLRASTAGADSADNAAATGPVASNGNQPPVDRNAALTELQKILAGNFGIEDPSAIDPNGPRKQVAFIDDLPYLAPLIALIGAALGTGEAGRQAHQKAGQRSGQDEESEGQTAKPQISPFMTPAPPIETKVQNIPPTAPEMTEPLVTPIPDPIWDQIPEGIPGFGPEDKPYIEVFPDQSGEIPQIVILENRRGTPRTQDFNTDIARDVDAIGQDERIGVTHKGGARTEKGQNVGEHYERPPGGRRSGGTYIDVTHQSTRTGRYIHIQSIDTWADGETPTARETRNNLRALVNKRTGDLLILVPKPKEGETFDHEVLKKFLRPYIQEIDRPHTNKDTEVKGMTDDWHLYRPGRSPE